jgi:capsular polysaccharide biosynthesis protein
MEDVDIRELMDVIKSKLLFIIILTNIVIICGTAYLKFFKTPEYKSSTTIVLASNSGEASTITTSDVTINKNLVSTYSQIAKSRRVLDPVISSLGLNLSYEELAKKITVSEVGDTEIIQISVVDKDASIASLITNQIAKSFTEEVSDIYNMKNVKILDVGTTADKPYNVNYIKQFWVSFAIGLGLSLVIVFSIYFLNNTIKTPEEIETKIGLPILGRIPLQKGSKKHVR